MLSISMAKERRLINILMYQNTNVLTEPVLPHSTKHVGLAAYTLLFLLIHEIFNRLKKADALNSVDCFLLLHL